ncbi:MAG TPA: class I SAM-dependent RNA methyltransferase, partial [Acetobacteraceae bacterium]|nr:class I SAM-dependent RNA methyltransferase [Acetobacteraceae bacterium]
MAARRPGSTPSAADRPGVVGARIERVGAEGDGIAAAPDGTRLYVPLTLPGEWVWAQPLARRGDGFLCIDEGGFASSTERVHPPCRHFGTCGGCVLQHWRDAAYREWKAGLLRDALRLAGFRDAPISPVVPTPPGARRRMDLAIRRAGRQVTVGLHRLRATEVVDLQTCHVLHPRLVALIEPLRRLLHGVSGLRAEGSAVVNLLESGPDVLLRTDRPLTVQDRGRLLEFARAY